MTTSNAARTQLQIVQLYKKVIPDYAWSAYSEFDQLNSPISHLFLNKMQTKKARAFIFLLLFFQITSSNSQSLNIGQFDSQWGKLNACKQWVLADSELKNFVYKNDFVRFEATYNYYLDYAKTKYGMDDAGNLALNAAIKSQVMVYGKEGKPFRDIPLKDKLAELDWCRNIFIKP